MKMDMVTADVMLASDIRQVVHRGLSNPISLPEVEVLRFIHGESAVNNIKFLETITSTPGEEKIRLLTIYGGQAVETVYPGRHPGMEMSLNDAPAPAQASTDPAKRSKRGRKRAEPANPDPDVKNAPPEWAQGTAGDLDDAIAKANT